MKELIIPEAAQRDEDSIEMIRVWIAERGLHASLNVGLYGDRPAFERSMQWGRIPQTSPSMSQMLWS